MHKITVLYGHPENIEAFEDYYNNKHLPLAATLLLKSGANAGNNEFS